MDLNHAKNGLKLYLKQTKVWLHKTQKVKLQIDTDKKVMTRKLRNFATSSNVETITENIQEYFQNLQFNDVIVTSIYQF